MSFCAHSAFLCDRLLNMFCSAAYKLAPPFGHIKVELCPGLESNSWTKSAKPQCLCGIILFVLLYRNHRSGARFQLLSFIFSSTLCVLNITLLLSANNGDLCEFCRWKKIEEQRKKTTMRKKRPASDSGCRADTQSVGSLRAISPGAR